MKNQSEIIAIGPKLMESYRFMDAHVEFIDNHTRKCTTTHYDFITAIYGSYVSKAICQACETAIGGRILISGLYPLTVQQISAGQRLHPNEHVEIICSLPKRKEHSVEKYSKRFVVVARCWMCGHLHWFRFMNKDINPFTKKTRWTCIYKGMSWKP